MGPTMLFHLGAGPGGISSFCERYTDSFNRWWDDLGVLYLDAALAKQLSDGVAENIGNETTVELSAKRDALIVAMQKAIAKLQRS
jgi:3-hydroxybutyryl-CoA dehydrogenase